MTAPGRAWLSAAAALLLFAPASARAEEEVRIALFAKQASLEVSGRDLAVYDGESGTRLEAWSGPAEVQVLARRGQLHLVPETQSQNASRRLLLEARGGLRVGKGTYLGRLEVVVEASGSTLLVINRLPIETYLLGIVGSEMNPEWPIEALKAQAVAARTYAMQRRMMMRAANRPYDLESSVLSQVYKGADRIRPSVVRAVRDTHGEVMSYRHGLVEALFHSTCGGRTESAKIAFGRAVPYLVPESCPWCRDSSLRRWRLDLPLRELSSMLEAARLTRSDLKTLERRAGASLVTVRDKRGGQAVSPKQVRQAVGYGVLYSEHFTARTQGSRVEFEGSGFGHGVGMCQWGARGMALAGKTHAEILDYYYKGVRVQRIY